MHKWLLFFCFLFIVPTVLHSQYTKAENDVIELLQQQADDWNAGDLRAFMRGYENTPDLVFVSSRGVTYGWQTVLDNYEKNYPDEAARGQLRFELEQVKQQNRKIVSVVGKFILDRKEETLSGYFLLLVKKIKGQWYIVADHTS